MVRLWFSASLCLLFLAWLPLYKPEQPGPSAQAFMYPEPAITRKWNPLVQILKTDWLNPIYNLIVLAEPDKTLNLSTSEKTTFPVSHEFQCSPEAKSYVMRCKQMCSMSLPESFLGGGCDDVMVGAPTAILEPWAQEPHLWESEMWGGTARVTDEDLTPALDCLHLLCERKIYAYFYICMALNVSIYCSIYCYGIIYIYNALKYIF